MSQKLGSLIIDIEGTQLSPEERDLLAHPLVGGVILFTRNHQDLPQLKQLIQSIRNVRETPLLIMADQEGGRVQRFQSGFTRLPALGELGKLYHEDQEAAVRVAVELGWLMAIEMLHAGIDLSLAPVLDLNKNLNTVIGDRAFHTQPEAVIKLAKAYIFGMREAGMAATGKHFPGHGAVALDSHVAMPIDPRPYLEIERDDMIPFAALINANIAAIMAAHIIFPDVDDKPVGFSRTWLQDILRIHLDFKGIIFSDDLNMAGADISANYEDRVFAAREAGCDFALLCNNREAVVQVLDKLPYAAHRVNEEKWGALQSQFSGMEEPLEANERWQKVQAMLNDVQTETEILSVVT
jgi:beta-N-acetylhexosaminidase